MAVESGQGGPGGPTWAGGAPYPLGRPLARVGPSVIVSISPEASRVLVAQKNRVKLATYFDLP